MLDTSFTESFARFRSLTQMSPGTFASLCHGEDTDYDTLPEETALAAFLARELAPGDQKHAIDHMLERAIGWVVCPCCSGAPDVSAFDSSGVEQDWECPVCEDYPGGYVPASVAEEFERQEELDAELEDEDDIPFGYGMGWP